MPQTNYENSPVLPPGKTISFSAIFNIIVYFYQIKSLVKVEGSSKVATVPTLTTTSSSTAQQARRGPLAFIDEILNLKVLAVEGLDAFCPLFNLDIPTKEALRGYGIPSVMMASLTIAFILCRILKIRNRFSSCLIVGFYIVLSFCFKDLSNVSLKLINCVKVEGLRVLYISGDVKCGHWWQTLTACFLGVWVIPFPLAMIMCYSLIRSDSISTTMFLACLAFPVIAPFIFIYHLRQHKTLPSNENEGDDIFPVGKVIKQSLEIIEYRCRVQETPRPQQAMQTNDQNEQQITFYQKRAEEDKRSSKDSFPEEKKNKMKNVIFDQKARRQFQEIFEDPYRDQFWWWEMWRIVEKLIFSVLSVFIHNLLIRIYVMGVVLLFLAYFHFRLKPYKDEMFVLYRLDIVSYICLFFQLLVSLIRVFVIVYGSPVKDTFDFQLESVLIPLWYLPIYFFVYKIKLMLRTRRIVKQSKREHDSVC